MELGISKRFRGSFELNISGEVDADTLYGLYLEAGGTDYKDRVDEMQNELDREGERIVGLEDQYKAACDAANDLQDTVERLQRTVDEQNDTIIALNTELGRD